jgi:hypothetical protein
MLFAILPELQPFRFQAVKFACLLLHYVLFSKMYEAQKLIAITAVTLHELLNVEHLCTPI